MSYIDVQEGRSGTKGTVMPYLGDLSVCLGSSYKYERLKADIFFFLDHIRGRC